MRANSNKHTVTAVKRIQIAFIATIALLFLGWLPKLSADKVPWHLDNDFAHYYLAGELLRAGMNPYTVELQPLYTQHGFTPTRTIREASAPPALAVVMSPFSMLPPLPSFIIWTAVQIGSLLLGVALLLKRCDLVQPMPRSALVMIASLAPLGVFAHIRYGQAQAIMFGFVAVGIVLLSRSQRWAIRLGSFLWGVSASLKLFTAPLGLVALRYHGWAGLAWFTAGFFSLWGVFVGLCGWEALQTFFDTTLPALRDLSVAFNGNLSFSAAVTYTQRLLGAGEVIPVSLTQVVSVLLLVPFALWESRERADLVGSSTMMLAACCLLSPTTWPHYLPLLTGGFVYLLAQSQQSARPEASQLATLVLYLCMGVAMGYLAVGDPATQLISAWWGPLCIISMLALLCAARRRSGLFTRAMS